MFSAAQIISHLIGDYVIQSDAQAVEKTKQWKWALYHACTYAMPFLLLTHSVRALAFIILTHAVIDRLRLARYLCWAKNFVGSPWSKAEFVAFLAWRPGMPFPAEVWNAYRRPWAECTKTGYPDDRPAWLSTWLLIIADNCAHLVLNGVALEWIR
jgi:hypothetical protein